MIQKSLEYKVEISEETIEVLKSLKGWELFMLFKPKQISETIGIYPNCISVLCDRLTICFRRRNGVNRDDDENEIKVLELETKSFGDTIYELNTAGLMIKYISTVQKMKQFKRQMEHGRIKFDYIQTSFLISGFEIFGIAGNFVRSNKNDMSSYSIDIDLNDNLKLLASSDGYLSISARKRDFEGGVYLQYFSLGYKNPHPDYIQKNANSEEYSKLRYKSD